MRKTLLNPSFAVLVFILLGVSLHSFSNINQPTMKPKKEEKIGLLVILKAQKGKEEIVKKFLKDGLEAVNKEPQTVSWFAFQIDDQSFGIFDTFESNDGRQEHLSGAVAKALLLNAKDLLEGFDPKTSIQHLDVLWANKITGDEKKGLLVLMEVKEGKSKEAEEFFKTGKQLVQSEPQTLSWYAIKLSEKKYAIFDTFTDEAGRSAHLQGQIAAALMKNTPVLLQDFDPNAIQKIDIIASK